VRCLAVREVVGVDVDELAFDGDLAARSPGTGAEAEREDGERHGEKPKEPAGGAHDDRIGLRIRAD
jgi:hypothetical protein